MNMKFIPVILVLVLALTVPVMLSEDAAAEPDTYSYYCYGDHPIMSYQYAYQPTMSVEWAAVGELGNTLVCDPEKGQSTTVDISGEPYGSRITVTQSVYNNSVFVESATVVLIPLHIGDDEYTVTFMDGADIIRHQTIDHKTLVIEGDDHVIMPAAPVKDGYRFDGWYSDTGFQNEFDSKQPITGDTVVYAKWVGTGTGGTSSTITVNNTRVVTFNVETGLEYKVTGQSGTTVSFTVGVVGGYQLDGDVMVSSDIGTITSSDGVYTLSGITGNTIVTIEGDVSPIEPEGVPPEEATGFPWWILAVIVVVVLVLVACYLKYRS